MITSDAEAVEIIRLRDQAQQRADHDSAALLHAIVERMAHDQVFAAWVRKAADMTMTSAELTDAERDQSQHLLRIAAGMALLLSEGEPQL